MAQTTRRRRNNNTQARNANRNRSSTNTASHFGRFCEMTFQDNGLSVPQKIGQISTWLLAHDAGTTTTNASKSIVERTALPAQDSAEPRARGRPRQRIAPPARRTATRSRDAAGGGDLDRAILATMPDTSGIQQNRLLESVQQRYPNRWANNVIARQLARMQKTGSLISQGERGNNRVWSLARPDSRQEPESRAA